MAYTYFVLKRPEHEDSVLVWDTRTLPVGRSRENALVLDDAEVSRKHALFTKEGERCEVGDYQTGNGTYVNGQRVSGQRPLRPADVIEIGKVQMIFYVTEEHPSKLGHKVQFSSQLMTVGSVPAARMQGGVDPNSTMLGMAESLPGVDDDFVIEHEGTERGITLGVNEIPDLDLDIVSPSPERPPFELDLDDPVLAPEPPAAPPPRPAPAPAPARTAPPARPAPARQAPAPPGAARPAATAPATSRRPLPPAPAAPSGPGDSQSGGDPLERMRRLKSLLQEGLITQAEFDRKRAAILDEV